MWLIICLLALGSARNDFDSSEELGLDFDASPFDYEEAVGADIFKGEPDDFDPYMEETPEVKADDEVALGYTGPVDRLLDNEIEEFYMDSDSDEVEVGAQYDYDDEDLDDDDGEVGEFYDDEEDGDMNLDGVFFGSEEDEDDVGDDEDDFFVGDRTPKTFPEEDETAADMPDYLFGDDSDDGEVALGDILSELTVGDFDDILHHHLAMVEEAVGSSPNAAEHRAFAEDLVHRLFDSEEEEDEDALESDEYYNDDDEYDEYELAAEMPDYLFEDSDEEEVGADMPDYLFNYDDSDEAELAAEMPDYLFEDSDEEEVGADMPDYLFDYEDSDEEEVGEDAGMMPDYLFDSDSEDSSDVSESEDSEDSEDEYDISGSDSSDSDEDDEYDSYDMDDSDDSEDEVGYEYLDDDSQEDVDSEDALAEMPDYLYEDSEEADAFQAFEDALDMDDEVEVGEDSEDYEYDDEDDTEDDDDEDYVADDDDDSDSQDGDEEKDKKLLVYFLQKVLHKLPLATRVMFVRKFKKRYENPTLRKRMFDIINKMRSTMSDQIDSPQFRDRLTNMVDRIRGRITDQFTAARTMMAAEGKLPPNEPVNPAAKEHAPAIAKDIQDRMAAQRNEQKFDSEANTPGKYPLTKFYGNQPVVVYYVPIIAGDKKANDQIAHMNPKLQTEVKEKLQELENNDF